MDFVDFNLAKKLKDLGFNEPFFFFYREDDKDKDVHHAIIHKPLIYCDEVDDEVIIAPTISQVLKWLRKEKKISIEISLHCSLKWMCSIYGFSDGIADFTQYNNDGIDDTIYILYDSYEQAALAGVNYCLGNLI